MPHVPFDFIYQYLLKGVWPPTVCTKGEKANFRKACRPFAVKGEELFYKKVKNDETGEKVEGPHDIQVFWSLEEHTAEDVADYLFHTLDLDWSQHLFSISLPDILLPSLQLLENIGGRQVRIQPKLHGHLYIFQEPAILSTKQIKLLPEYQVTHLKEDDVSLIWKNWEFNSLDSVNSMRHSIINFPSVGIRKRIPTDNTGQLQEEAGETLVSWVRMSKYGYMGSTFTLPQHRRRGLASTATLILTRQLQQESLLPAVIIENSNTASIKFHSDLGFERQCALSMVVLLPA